MHDGWPRLARIPTGSARKHQAPAQQDSKSALPSRFLGTLYLPSLSGRAISLMPAPGLHLHKLLLCLLWLKEAPTSVSSYCCHLPLESTQMTPGFTKASVEQREQPGCLVKLGRETILV
jgi:hypothetical protein